MRKSEPDCLGRTKDAVEIQNNRIQTYTPRKSEVIPLNDTAAMRLKADPEGFFFFFFNLFLPR